jgi:hypothetical protein
MPIGSEDEHDFGDGTLRAAEDEQLTQVLPRASTPPLGVWAWPSTCCFMQHSKPPKAMASKVTPRPKFLLDQLEQRERTNPQVCGYMSGYPGALPKIRPSPDHVLTG